MSEQTLYLSSCTWTLSVSTLLEICNICKRFMWIVTITITVSHWCVIVHRRHSHCGGREKQAKASGPSHCDQSAAAGSLTRAGTPRGPSRQLLPLHQCVLCGGRGRVRPRVCPGDAEPHRPDRVQRPGGVLRSGAGQDQRGVLHLDQPGRHLGRSHRGVHPVQVLPVRDLRGGHSDGPGGPVRGGRRLPQARAAHLRRHPLRPAAERDPRLRHAPPDYLLHHGRRDPGPRPRAGGRGSAQAAVHGRKPLCAALHGVPDRPGGTEGSSRARQGNRPHQFRGGVISFRTPPPPLLSQVEPPPNPCPMSGDCVSPCLSACVILYLTLPSDIHGEPAAAVFQPLTCSVLYFQKSEETQTAAPVSPNHHSSVTDGFQIDETGSRKNMQPILRIWFNPLRSLDVSRVVLKHAKHLHVTELKQPLRVICAMMWSYSLLS